MTKGEGDESVSFMRNSQQDAQSSDASACGMRREVTDTRRGNAQRVNHLSRRLCDKAVPRRIIKWCWRSKFFLFLIEGGFTDLM